MVFFSKNQNKLPTNIYFLVPNMLRCYQYAECLLPYCLLIYFLLPFVSYVNFPLEVMSYFHRKMSMAGHTYRTFDCCARNFQKQLPRKNIISGTLLNSLTFLNSNFFLYSFWIFEFFDSRPCLQRREACCGALDILHFALFTHVIAHVNTNISQCTLMLMYV